MVLVGEVGIPRKEYLYDLSFCDIMLILRGYYRRHHTGWEQARLVAYNAHYCMGAKDTPPVPSEWLPLPWEKEQADGNIPSNEEVERMRREMMEYNNRQEQNQT